jgi:hypothetical protein
MSAPNAMGNLGFSLGGLLYMGPSCAIGTAPARIRLFTNSQHGSAIELPSLCHRRHCLADIHFVRRVPAKRLVRVTSVVPVEEPGEAVLLLESNGRRAQIDPLVPHRPAQALHEDVAVATTAPIHARLDPMIQQHPRKRFTANGDPDRY